jgi:hypothetical protein
MIFQVLYSTLSGGPAEVLGSTKIKFEDETGTFATN